MDAVIGTVLAFFAFLPFAFISIWVMSKFFGIKTHSRGQFQQAHNKSLQEKNSLSMESPEDIAEGIKRCEKKFYAKTHSNVLSEIRGIKREREGRTASDLAKKSLANLKDKAVNLAGNIGQDKFDKLEKLRQLRNLDVLTDAEFEEEKRKILEK